MLQDELNATKAKMDAAWKEQEEARMKADYEERLKVENEAKKKALDEAQQKAEELEKLKAEQEARLKAEEEAKQKAEAEARGRLRQTRGVKREPPDPAQVAEQKALVQLSTKTIGEARRLLQMAQQAETILQRSKVPESEWEWAKVMSPGLEAAMTSTTATRERAAQSFSLATHATLLKIHKETLKTWLEAQRDDLGKAIDALNKELIPLTSMQAMKVKCMD